MQSLRKVFVLMGLAAILGLLLAGCAGVQQPGASEGEAEMKPEPGKITVMNVRARPSPASAANGAAYMVILNGLDQDVTMVSAESDVAATVETHETVNDNGVMRMIPKPEGYEIPAGGSVELKPGGKHIMLIDLAKPLETGDEFELTLNFDDGETMTVTVPVVEMDGMPMKMDESENK